MLVDADIVVMVGHVKCPLVEYQSMDKGVKEDTAPWQSLVY